MIYPPLSDVRRDMLVERADRERRIGEALAADYLRMHRLNPGLSLVATLPIRDRIHRHYDAAREYDRQVAEIDTAADRDLGIVL